MSGSSSSGAHGEQPELPEQPKTFDFNTPPRGYGEPEDHPIGGTQASLETVTLSRGAYNTALCTGIVSSSLIIAGLIVASQTQEGCTLALLPGASQMAAEQSITGAVLSWSGIGGNLATMASLYFSRADKAEEREIRRQRRKLRKLQRRARAIKDLLNRITYRYDLKIDAAKVDITEQLDRDDSKDRE